MSRENLSARMLENVTSSMMGLCLTCVDKDKPRCKDDAIDVGMVSGLPIDPSALFF